jgi:hypothetical protein
MSIYCGIDWAEHHHDIALVDEAGQVLAQRRVGDDVAGFTALTELLARWAPGSAEVDIAIETDRGLFVHALVAAGYRVYAVNPKAVDRYRDRYRVSRAKSDGADALVLEHLVRTDRSQHRRIPTDSDLAAAVSVLARAHQDTVRERGRLVRRLRSQLREYYPAALEAFKDLSIRTAVTILSAAPTPALAAQLSHDDILQLARSCGRWGISHREVTRLHTVLHRDQLRQPAVVEDAMGSAVTAILLNLRITTATLARLEAELAEHLDQHGDAPILRSLPGVASVLAGRMLGEFGDDPDRFVDAARRRDYAGTAPITKASGKSRVVLMRRTRNTRLSGACRDWAFTASNQSPGAHAYYLHRRMAGDGHEAALRRLGNKLVGQLHHCLEHREPYREEVAWPSTIAA